MRQGYVEWVDTIPARSFLAEDAAASQATLVLQDGQAFADAAQVTIAGAQYAIDSLDLGEGEDATATLTLTMNLPALVELGEPVDVFPEVLTTWAGVVLPDEVDSVTIRVPQSPQITLPLGIREPNSREVITYEDGADGPEVTAIDGRAVIDGGLIDPDTLPPSPPYVPTDPPVDAPVLTIAPFAIGALLASWTEVENAQWYDVYASLTPGFDSDDVANRVLTGVTGLQATVASIADTQIPVDGVTPVYVVVKAVNVVGAGPASNEASGMARQADEEFLSALYGWFGTVEAQTAILGSLNVVMNVDVDGVISIGPRITIADADAPDGKGGIIIWGDDAHTIVLARLHPDGNYLDGILVAQEITVIQALRLIGEASAIASGGKMKLENGVADPAAPSLSTGPILINWPAIPAGYAERGICWDAANGQWWQLLWKASAPAGARVRTISTSGVASGLTVLDSAADSGETLSSANTIAYLGGKLFIAVRCVDASFVIWKLASFNTSGTLLEYTNLGYNTGTTPDHFRPGVCTDGTSIFATGMDPASSTIVKIGRWDTDLAYLDIAKINSTSIPDVETAYSMGVGNFDRGTPLVQVGASTGVVYHFTKVAFNPVVGSAPTLVAAPSHDFAIDAGSWLDYKSSGSDTGFYSSKSDAKLARWSSYFPAGSEKWWAQSVDLGAAGVHTGPSPASDGLAVSARRFVSAALNPAPTGVTGADVYIGYGTTNPVVKYRRTESVASRSVTLTSGKVTTGTQLARAITNKARTGTNVTLTSNAHGLIVGDIVVVADVDPALNGTFVVTAIATNTFQYSTIASGTIASAAASGTASLTNTMGGVPAEIFDDAGNSWRGDGVITVITPTAPTQAANKGYVDAGFAAGSGSTPAVGATNTTYLEPIVFPVGRFDVPPTVIPSFAQAIASTNNSYLWAQDVTTTGANIGIRRSITSGAVPFNWIAVADR